MGREGKERKDLLVLDALFVKGVCFPKGAGICVGSLGK